MATKERFRVSSFLKDIIGRDLVTNEFVAIFELVKNAFDANATRVEIEFDPTTGTVAIVDDGHGMSALDIRDKWLRVARSEKADASSESYRDKIQSGGHFAGSKGIGRFACDTLGERLELFSRDVSDGPISTLQIDWTAFEQDSDLDFQNISLELNEAAAFPTLKHVQSPSGTGTVLLIRNARQQWTVERIQKLRRDIAKLIDPFGTTDNVAVSTWLIGPVEKGSTEVNGPVGNPIADLLRDKTTRIKVKLEHGFILSTLYDRGRKLFEIREPSPYTELGDVVVEGEIYFLNQAAKYTFNRRMGVKSVEFGSVFLFLNGFRVSPIGEETDDTLGLNRRKQQGSSRYFGTRDILGRVDVAARPKQFRVVSSRDAGLIEDANSRALYEAIRRHMVFRLERYVVGVNWPDKQEQMRETSDGLETDIARARIVAVMGGLARTKDVEILYFDRELVRVSDDPDRVTKEAIRAMSDLAESSGDSRLLYQIEQTRRRIEELKAAKEDALREAQRAQEERAQADARIVALKKQAEFLGSSKDLDIERVQLLMHQANIHLGHLQAAITNAASEARALVKSAESPIFQATDDDLEDLFASIRQSSRHIFGRIASAKLSGDRLHTVLSFAPNIRIDLETDKVNGDLVNFLSEYIEVRLKGLTEIPEVTIDTDGHSLIRDFSPVDMAVLIDNLVDNSRKAEAEKLSFVVQSRTPKSIVIAVSDDGVGLDPRRIEPALLFERGYSGTVNGSGIGLYSVREIVSDMGGSIKLVGDGTRADFEITLSGEAK